MSSEELEPDTDEEYQTATSSKRKVKGKGYRLTNVLKLPRATTYTTQALYEQIHGGDIDLNPEYQRDVVWPESKQIGLIDSIFRNYYIPPVIFASNQHEDGTEIKTCIDGKQRLTSIYKFMDGLIPYRDPFTHEKFWYKVTSGDKKSIKPLPDQYRRLFMNKQVVCIEYQELSDSDEREIFQRVQLGMALTPAEKLQVTNSPMAAFVRTLLVQYFGPESALGNDALDWDRSRGGDFRCVSQALYLMSRFPGSLTVGSITQLEKWLKNPTAQPGPAKKAKKKTGDDEYEDPERSLMNDEPFLNSARDTFRTLSELVGSPSLGPIIMNVEKRVAPIEFIAMCLLTYAHRDSMSQPELAKKIGEMRALVRKEHVDIRMNSRVAKTLTEFARSLGSGAAAKDDQVPKKRKRVEDVEMEEGEQPEPKRNFIPPSRPGNLQDGGATNGNAYSSSTGPLPSTPTLPPSDVSQAISMSSRVAGQSLIADGLAAFQAAKNSVLLTPSMAHHVGASAEPFSSQSLSPPLDAPVRSLVAEATFQFPRAPSLHQPQPQSQPQGGTLNQDSR